MKSVEANEIIVKADKIRRKKRRIKIAKLLLLILILLVLAIYIIVGIIYNNGNFSITLDKNLYLSKNIIIYDNEDYKVYRSELYAQAIDVLDNISFRWLPTDISEHSGGSHNGDNYIAYTFYIENLGKEVSDYYTRILIDDVIKNVDRAVRVRVYKDRTETTYAKLSHTGRPETDTVPFESDEVIASDHIESFSPGERIKYTIVIWLEGNDLDCTDNIIGGEIKLHMEFNSEFVEK